MTDTRERFMWNISWIFDWNTKAFHVKHIINIWLIHESVTWEAYHKYVANTLERFIQKISHYVTDTWERFTWNILWIYDLNMRAFHVKHILNIWLKYENVSGKTYREYVTDTWERFTWNISWICDWNMRTFQVKHIVNMRLIPENV